MISAKKCFFVAGYEGYVTESAAAYPSRRFVD
jgi:hypothetical protein